jgi:hypothetical protein
MDTILGILFVLFGVFSAVAIFVPRLRMPWRGRGKSVRSGPVTNLGFALFFTTAGVFVLFRPSESVVPPAFRVAWWLAFLCIIIGFVLDFRSAKKRDRE